MGEAVFHKESTLMLACGSQYRQTKCSKESNSNNNESSHNVFLCTTFLSNVLFKKNMSTRGCVTSHWNRSLLGDLDDIGESMRAD